VTAPVAGGGPARELARFLELQNVGLNLPFALAFLLLAANGLPSAWVFLLIVVAFLAARNAGHSFNRWADRDLDAANPRTRSRALPSGQRSPAFALAICAASSAVLLVAAALLNMLALLLAPVALVLVLGYSYTKRFTSLTTPFLGLVEAITPAAVFVAVRATLPPVVLLAVVALLAWGTAFETVHSLGDLDADRAQGLRSLPARLGVDASVRLVPVLHAVALLALGLFGLFLGLGVPYYVGLAGMAVLVVVTDRDLARAPSAPRVPFRRHFAMAAVYLTGVAAALFVHVGPSFHPL
jgi:4-hydroxybenzoate polyprenyltransferase